MHKISTLIDYKFIKMDCIRGFGIVGDYFKIFLVKDGKHLVLETESNFRVLNDGKVLICFNDIYLNLKSERISTRQFRSQSNIEKTLLFKKINDLNNEYSQITIKDVSIMENGDVKIILDKNIIFEIINDSSLKDVDIVRLYDDQKNLLYRIENTTYIF